jgi:hypothetical protein
MFESRRKDVSARITTFVSVLLVAFAVASCGKPVPDPNTAIGKQAILDDVNNFLTAEDCASAIAEILPLYNSQNTDNQVRMLTAASYACEAHVNFFKVLSDMANDASTLSGGNIWGYFAQLFPSVKTDKVSESAGYAMTTLMGVIPAGQVISLSDLITGNSYNTGSLNSIDRTSDANIYMLFVSMAGIGGPESRWGVPDSGFHPTSSLPWTDNTSKMDEEGCIYASAILNFFDVLGPASSSLPGSASDALSSVTSFDTSVFNKACDFGCKGTLPSDPVDIAEYNPTGKWNATGCFIAAGCSECPKLLKDYTQCHPNVANDPGACAAAGLVNFINASLVGWQ